MTAPDDLSMQVPVVDPDLPHEATCDLTLFVSGASDLSSRAIKHVREMCDVHLRGRSRLTVVDVHEHTGARRGHAMLATPTLVKNRPLPTRQVVGDLSDVRKVLVALGLSDPVDAPAATMGQS
jgi:circadian clock protein KaiB